MFPLLSRRPVVDSWDGRHGADSKGKKNPREAAKILKERIKLNGKREPRPTK